MIEKQGAGMQELTPLLASSRDALMTARSQLAVRLDRIAQWGPAYPIALFLLMRLTLSVWSAAVWILMAPDTPRTLYDLFLAPWQRWDTQWYMAIAEHGYGRDVGAEAFFPLYPLFVRGVSQTFGIPTLVASLLVSNVAALFGLLALYSLVKRLSGEITARRSVLLLVAFPSAFFLFAGYTESLFLLLAVIIIDQAEKGRWWVVGVAGALASATRFPGVFLILPALVAAYRHWKARRFANPSLAWVALMPAGLVGYVLYLAFQFRDPVLFLHGVSNWRRTVLPWEPIFSSIRELIPGTLAGQNPIQTYTGIALNALDLGLTLLFVGLAVTLIFKRRYVLFTYMAVVVVIPLLSTSTVPSTPPLFSMTRYLLVAFPGLIALAEMKSRGPCVLIVSCFLALQLFLAALFELWVSVG